MNFFFLSANEHLKSVLTIPKFRNSGQYTKLRLHEARIFNDQWSIGEPSNTVENEHFWTVKSSDVNQNSIFFLGDEPGIEEIEKANKLLNIETFTKTDPEFRANLSVENIKGGFSSYQSEYPFGMATKLGQLLTDCGLLTFATGTRVGVFIRNICVEPLQSERRVFLYDTQVEKVIFDFSVQLNKLTYVDLTEFKDVLSQCFLFSDDFIGIPIYIVEFSDGSISFEHTHPPHSAVLGQDRYKLVSALKREAHEKIFKKSV